MTYYKATTLAKVTSHGSGGRAKIIVSPCKSEVARDQLTSKKFLNYATGDKVIVQIDFDPATKVRRIISVKAYDAGVMDFAKEYQMTLKEQEVEIKQALMTLTATEAVVKVLSSSPMPAPTSAWCDAFYVQDEERNAFDMALKLSSELPSKVMIIGASGYGKTSLPKAFAKQNEMNYVRFNVALVRDPEEFFGWRTVEDGNVKFIPSEFTKAISAGNCVVVLDELNRATPEMANALFPILDDDARTVVFGEEIVVGPNTIIVCTVNMGYQFVGTFAIDQALLNRMDITLRVAPLPYSVETEILVRRAKLTSAQASVIVKVCNRLRDLTNSGKIIVDASTRTSIRVAKFVAAGASFQDAFAWALINGCDIEERKEVIDTISSLI